MEEQVKEEKENTLRCRGQNRSDQSSREFDDRIYSEEFQADFKEPVDLDGDDKEKALVKWRELMEQTTEMCSLAENCQSFTALPVGKNVVSSLQSILEFMKGRENPGSQDVQYVDEKMQILSKLVGEAFDTFILDKRVGNGGAHVRILSVVKIVAGCFILVCALAAVTESFPSMFTYLNHIL